MHVLIYGAGALGQALGCMLAAAGNQVTLVIRERFIEVIGRTGLSVEGIFGNYHVEAEKLSLTTSIAGADGSLFDAALITTKSYDTPAAVIDLQSLRGCSCPIVSMQNGCGNVEQLLRAFGADRSLGARVITGFEITEPARVSITVSADDIHIGGGVSGTIPEQATLLARTIADAGLPCIAVEDIHLSLFAKLLYNCALNPLGAILGVNYGALAEQRESRAIMDAVIEETFTVVGAMGKKLPWADPEEYRDYFYQTLIPATCDHRPSMLQDLEQGKATEVDALVGYVSQNGQSRSLATPCCDLLGRLIRFKERTVLSN
jgi:2-dehydropantoate 2-reductase